MALILFILFVLFLIGIIQFIKKYSILETNTDTEIKNKNEYSQIYKAKFLPNEIDDGKKLFAHYQFDVVGSKYKHFGNIGYDGIAEVDVGDDVILKPDPTNTQDSKAVAVFTNNNMYCGWLPASNYVSNDDDMLEYTGKYTTFNKLSKGTPYKAKVIYTKYDDDFNPQISIIVGFYKIMKNVEITDFENGCFSVAKSILQNNSISTAPLKNNKNSKYYYIYYQPHKYSRNIVQIGHLKKYFYALIQDENEIAKIKENNIAYEDAPKLEKGIRVILNSPTDINKLSDIIVNRINNFMRNKDI